MRYTALLLLLSLPFFAKAQLHKPVLPDLEGGALLQSLQDQYRPNSVLPYNRVRDTLFRNIDASNDTLYGVYTEFAVYLPPGEDPTEAAFEAGINTEHSYPRGKGADGFVPESDMHHLFPTRVQVNADRANFPYAEVPDDEAIKWYYNDQTVNFQPSADTGQFSELGVMAFEPPDAYKGDIARAIFYFYTMYTQEADAEDPDFFELQRPTLCQWQAQDPVDQREWDRTQAIAEYQEGKANPFVLDCTLATRCYCAGEVPPCTPPVANRQLPPLELQVKAFPVPTVSRVQLQYNLPAAGRVEMVLYNSLGQQVDGQSFPRLGAGTHHQALELTVPAGLYTGYLYWEGVDGRRAAGWVRIMRVENE